MKICETKDFAIQYIRNAIYCTSYSFPNVSAATSARAHAQTESFCWHALSETSGIMFFSKEYTHTSIKTPAVQVCRACLYVCEGVAAAVIHLVCVLPLHPVRRCQRRLLNQSPLWEMNQFLNSHLMSGQLSFQNFHCKIVIKFRELVLTPALTLLT